MFDLNNLIYLSFLNHLVYSLSMELFCFPPVCRFMNSLADLYIKSIEGNMNSVIYEGVELYGD